MCFFLNEAIWVGQRTAGLLQWIVVGVVGGWRTMDWDNNGGGGLAIGMNTKGTSTRFNAI